jgi:hypothetical protein
MRNRLTERDLTRIVRRVLREENTSSMSEVCFNNTTISIPSSCKTNANFYNRDCLSDIGAMMTMKNLREVSKLLMCLAKGGTLPTDQDIQNVNDNKHRKWLNDYIKNLSPEEKVKFEKDRKENMRLHNK